MVSHSVLVCWSRVHVSNYSEGILLFSRRLLASGRFCSRDEMKFEEERPRLKNQCILILLCYSMSN